jgi:hypothetical protein
VVLSTFYLGISLRRLRKTTGSCSQDKPCLGSGSDVHLPNIRLQLQCYNSQLGLLTVCRIRFLLVEPEKMKHWYINLFSSDRWKRNVPSSIPKLASKLQVKTYKDFIFKSEDWSRASCWNFITVNCKSRRSQWPRGLRHWLSSPARTLGPWIRIPFEAWMSVCIYSVFMLSCVQVAALRWADPPPMESYRLCTGLRTEKAARAKQRAVEPLMNKWMNKNISPNGQFS